MLGQSNFSLFTARITRDRLKFERTRVSSLRISGFEMGEYAGELPRKFISFNCLENESNEPKDHNTEGIENYPDLPQRSKVEIVVIEETETSPTKNLTVLQVTGGEKTISEERGRVNKESLAVGSQECLLSSSDEGSEGLEKFLRDKLESLGGDGIENIAEVDPAEMLELLDSNLVDRDNTGSCVVTADDKFPRSQVDEILRAELGGKKIGVGSKRPLCDVELGVADERPSKSVAFEVDDSGEKSFCDRYTVVGVLDAGQSFPSSSRPDDTEYGTSELESIARRGVGSLSGGRVFEVAESDFLAISGATVQPGLGAGRSKYFPSESARTLLKECFAYNPPVQLDPRQQMTGMSSDQMIQFARAVGLEVSLATFGMLEDVLLKIGGKTGRNVGQKGSEQSASRSRSGSTVMESVASRSFYSLPTITESFDSDRLVGDLSQQPCSSRQADAALGFSRTEVNEFNDTDSLKTLGQIRSDARKKCELYKWSREGRPNPISPSGSDGGGYVFTEEMLELAPFAKIFATGPESPLKNRHCFYCMLCRRNVSMRSRGLYELKRHFQREHHLRADQRFRARYHPSKIRGSDGRTLYGSKLEAEKELFMHLDVPELDHKRPFYYDVVEGKPFTFTSASSRTLIQIELLLIFLQGGGQLWTLEEYWTQVGVLTGHSASTADFNWSLSHISVRI